MIDTRLNLGLRATPGNRLRVRPTDGAAGVEGEQLLQSLEVAGVLTAHQAEQLLSRWPHLGDWAADPYFHTVREHTRAYIEQASSSARSQASGTVCLAGKGRSKEKEAR